MHALMRLKSPGAFVRFTLLTDQFLVVLPPSLRPPLVVYHVLPDLLLLFSRLVPHGLRENQERNVKESSAFRQRYGKLFGGDVLF